MIILKALVLIFVVVLCLILALLFGLALVPFYCKSTLTGDKEYEATVGIDWLWGILGLEFVFLAQKKFISLKLFKSKIVTFPIRTKSSEEKREKALKKAERKARKKEEKRKRKPSLEKQVEQSLATIQAFSLEALREVIVLFSNLFSSLRLRLSGDAEVGLSNPADTGMLLGFFYAARGAFTITSFKLYPNWKESMFKGNITLDARVWIADIMRIAIKTVFASSIRKIWWPKVKGKLKFSGRVRSHAIEQ